MYKLKYRPFKDWLFVDLYDRGESKTDWGLILPDDDMKEFGIRPRWGRVVAVGPTFPDPLVKVGDRVLLEHLGWTKGLKLETVDGEEVKIWNTKEEKILIHEPQD